MKPRFVRRGDRGNSPLAVKKKQTELNWYAMACPNMGLCVFSVDISLSRGVLVPHLGIHMAWRRWVAQRACRVRGMC